VLPSSLHSVSIDAPAIASTSSAADGPNDRN
jgi:hypothetical protein